MQSKLDLFSNEASVASDVFTKVRAEHGEIRRRLDELIDRTLETHASKLDSNVAHELINSLEAELVAHYAAEEIVVYEALRDIPHRGETAETEIEEDRRCLESLRTLRDIDPQAPEWATQISLVKNQVESRIAEIEANVLNLLKARFQDGDEMDLPAEHLGKKYESALEEARAHSEERA